jgi:hypothetical protein
VSAWWAAVSPNAEDVVEMRQIEDRMYKSAIDSGAVTPNSEKRVSSADLESDAELGIEADGEIDASPME